MITKKTWAIAVILFAIVSGSVSVYAVPEEDFAKQMRKNDLQGMERILQRKASNMDLSICLGTVLLCDGRSVTSPIPGFNYRNNAMPTLKLLIKYGADLTKPISRVYAGHIKYPKKIGVATVPSQSVLRLAVSDQVPYEIIAFLIELGAPTNAVNVTGDSTLHVAVNNLRFDLVKLLVENGAYVNSRAHAGETASSIAYEKGLIEIVNYLQEHGAVKFEPKQVVTAPPVTPSNPPTTVYIESSPSSSNNAPQQPSTAQRIATELSRAAASMHTVTVWYMDNGTRKSISSIESATSKSEAERAAERKWKSINGFNNKLVFLEAVAIN